jgi:hypothetical protein
MSAIPIQFGFFGPLYEEHFLQVRERGFAFRPPQIGQGFGPPFQLGLLGPGAIWALW